MGLFDIKNHQIVVDPEKIMIPEFKEIWDADISKGKEKATRELSYVYYLSDWQSPYNNYPENVRKQKVKDDFIKDPNWEPGILINRAIMKYQEMQETPTIRLLRAARIGLNKLETYFMENEASDSKFTSNLEKIGKIAESLDKLEERIKKEQVNQSKVRGGGQIGSREA